MKGSPGLMTTVAAAAFVLAATYLHGRLTDRWTGRNVSDQLKEAAASMEREFPRQAGEWQAVDDIVADPRELERAGAVGHISRTFRRDSDGGMVAVFVVCATPRDASGHTPDRCYPGAGFEIAEAEHRETIPLLDRRSAEAFSGTFRKSGQTIRVFWTYGVDGRWVAPQIARIELADAAAVYKLYAIVDETTMTAGLGTQMCADFLRHMLPEFDAALKRTDAERVSGEHSGRPEAGRS